MLARRLKLGLTLEMLLYLGSAIVALRAGLPGWWVLGLLLFTPLLWRAFMVLVSFSCARGWASAESRAYPLSLRRRWRLYWQELAARTLVFDLTMPFVGRP